MPLALADLTEAEMRSFWGELDGALAALVWEPLRATGVLDGVEDILIATAGALHNLPFDPGRRGDLGRARLLHQSSLATFARSRGLFGSRPVVAGRVGTAAPVVSLLAHPEAKGIPLALVERRIAARLWRAAGATVVTAEDYPWDPARPVTLAHAACHGNVRTPPGGTPGAHLELRGLVSERALLAGPGAAAWLVGACVGGRVHDDRLDGNPTGLVAGALGAGAETVVAALPPLPDREGFLFGVLVTLLLTDGMEAPDLGTAASLAAALIGGERTAEGLATTLPPRVVAAFGGPTGLARRLPVLDRRLHAALVEDIAEDMADALVRARDPETADVQGHRLTTPLRSRAIKGAIQGALAAPVAWWIPEAIRTALIADLATLPTSASTDAANLASTLASRIAAATTQAFPTTFALLPAPDHNPAATGAIKHGMITFADPKHRP